MYVRNVCYTGSYKVVLVVLAVIYILACSHGSGLGGHASAEVLINQTPGSGGVDSVAEGPKVTKEEGSRHLEVPTSNAMALVPITVEAACEEFRPDNTGEVKGDC